MFEWLFKSFSSSPVAVTIWNIDGREIHNKISNITWWWMMLVSLPEWPISAISPLITRCSNRGSALKYVPRVWRSPKYHRSRKIPIRFKDNQRLNYTLAWFVQFLCCISILDNSGSCNFSVISVLFWFVQFLCCICILDHSGSCKSSVISVFCIILTRAIPLL